MIHEVTIAEVRQHVAERLAQHRENLHLWETGFLAPTELDPEERAATMRELRAATAELEALDKLLNPPAPGVAVRIIVDGRSVPMPKTRVVGVEIFAAAEVSGFYRLFHKKHGSKAWWKNKPIDPGVPIDLTEGMEFYSVPPATY